eukprot:7108551-Karenia_brevis.AAC.3
MFQYQRNCTPIVPRILDRFSLIPCKVPFGQYHNPARCVFPICYASGDPSRAEGMVIPNKKAAESMRLHFVVFLYAYDIVFKC